MTDPDFKRWAQAVRRQVRLLAADGGVPSGALLMWVTDNARKPGDVVAPGQGAGDTIDVRVNAREAILEHSARWAACARADRELGMVVLVVAGAGSVAHFFAELGADGRDLGGWERIDEPSDVYVQAGELMLRALGDVP